MKHPFAGVIIPDGEADGSRAELQSLRRWPAFLVSRRAVLGWVGAALGARLVFGKRLLAAEADKSTSDSKSSYSLYYVMPKDSKRLTAGTLKKLEITGEREKGWAARPQYEKTPGYWAWVDDAAADKIRQDPAIDAVEKFQSSDITEIGKPPLQGMQRILIELAPNAWKTKPKRGTFQTATDITRQWLKDFGPQQNTANGRVAMAVGTMGVAVAFVQSSGQIPSDVLSKIKENPQTVALKWIDNGLGSGGGLGSGAPTTQALGEEGGTTRYRVEEGGGGVTTRLLAEEGAGVTTRALGEEGGGQFPQQQ